jgi:hypothetical protein
MDASTEVGPIPELLELTRVACHVGCSILAGNRASLCRLTNQAAGAEPAWSQSGEVERQDFFAAHVRDMLNYGLGGISRARHQDRTSTMWSASGVALLA